MNITNEFLMELTKEMPMKQINITTKVPNTSKKLDRLGHLFEDEVVSKPYLQRYFAQKLNHIDIWIHRFLSADGERHVHSHPFEFCTGVLLGGYDEEMLSPDGIKKMHKRFPVKTHQLELIDFIIGDCNPEFFAQLRSVDLYDWHRIAEVQPETWTVMMVDKRRLKTWHFMDDNGNIETVMGSPRDWYKQYKPRGQNEGDVINV